VPAGQLVARAVQFVHIATEAGLAVVEVTNTDIEEKSWLG